MNIKQKKELIKIIIGLVLSIIVILFCSYFSVLKENHIISLILFITVYFFISYEIIINAIRNIFKGHILDENFLMFIATIGAFILGEYIEALAVILFYQIGEFFQNYAVNKSRKSISNLMDLTEEFAYIIKDNEIIKTDLSEIKIGDVLFVKPGEKIAVDGVIIEGDSSLDCRALTGEFKYKDVSVGSYVLSGMINVNGTIKIKAEKEYYDSTAAKILELVEMAGSVKSNPEKFITKFAKVYTPLVVFLAVILGVVPSLFTGNWHEWIYRALNFLVVSCPCALVISIPLSFFAGIGKASKMGILIKGSAYIEKFNKCETFVFDKTGTLTKGSFVVSDIITIYDKKEVLDAAVIAESCSNHPIAESIKKYYVKLFEKNDDYLNYQISEIPGKGIVASKENDIILCGNDKLLKSYNINVPKVNEVGTVCYIARNNHYLGAIIIKDEIKENSYKVINYINECKYQSVILSGDNKEIVEEVCNELAMSKYYSSLLPNEKLLKIDEIKENNSVVCFVGDGINDAPTLIKADVGISMGLKGSDVAIEASDIVIMDDDILSIVKLKKLAKKIMSIVYQNITLALFIKILVLVLSSFGLTNMWLAIFADVGVAIIAILNSMRVNLFKEK